MPVAWRTGLCGLPGLLLAGTALAMPPPPVTDPAFCSRVQQRLAGTTLVPENVIHADFPAFRRSKTVVRPLQTHQHTSDAPGQAGLPGRVSCKIKTPDHLIAEYGPSAAIDRGLGCADINRDTVRQVYASLTQVERRRLRITAGEIVFDADALTYTGSNWVDDYPYAYTDDKGRTHLHAKALRTDWNNLWLSWAPERLRGAWYCHLVAPEYVRRLVLGDAPAP